jgi:hypothetical protein
MSADVEVRELVWLVGVFGLAGESLRFSDMVLSILTHMYVYLACTAQVPIPNDR